MSTLTPSSSCLSSPSLPSTTGLGIRLSFYLLWFGLVPATLLKSTSPAPYTVLRASHAILCYAVFIGLAMKVVAPYPSSSASDGIGSDGIGFGAAEVYIATLLVSGTAYLMLGLVFWTGVRRCVNPGLGTGDEKVRERGSGRGGKKKGSRNKGGKEREGCDLLGIMEFILLLMVCGFQLWFWCSGVVGLARRRDEKLCEKQYGFLFAKADLDSVGFRAFNIAVVLIVLVGVMVMGVRSLSGGGGDEKKRRKKRGKRDGPSSGSNMDQLQLLFNLLIATAVLVAIELSILWNRVSSEVNKINSASQLIPLLFCLVLIAACIIDWFSSTPNGSNSSSRSSRSSGRGSRTSGSGSGGSGGSGGGGSGGSRRSRKESRRPSHSSASSSKSSPGPPRPSNIFPPAPPPPAAGAGGFRPPMPPMPRMPPPPFPPFPGAGPPGPPPPPAPMFGRGPGTRTASASGSRSGRSSNRHSEHESGDEHSYHSHSEHEEEHSEEEEGDYHPDSIDEEERGGGGRGSAPPPPAPAPPGAFPFPPQPPPPAQFPGAPPPLPPGFGPPGGGGGAAPPPGMMGRGSGGGPPAFFPFAPPSGGAGRGVVPPPLPPGFGPG